MLEVRTLQTPGQGGRNSNDLLSFRATLDPSSGRKMPWCGSPSGASPLNGTDCWICHPSPAPPDGSDHDFDCHSLWPYQEIYHIKQRIAPASASPMQNTGWHLWICSISIAIAPSLGGEQMPPSCWHWTDRTVWTVGSQAIPPKIVTRFNYLNRTGNPN